MPQGSPVAYRSVQVRIEIAAIRELNFYCQSQLVQLPPPVRA